MRDLLTHAPERLERNQFRHHPDFGVVRIDSQNGDNFWLFTDVQGVQRSDYGHRLQGGDWGDWVLLPDLERVVSREFVIEVLMYFSHDDSQSWLPWETYTLPSEHTEEIKAEVERLKVYYQGNSIHLDFRLTYVETLRRTVEVSL